jgi:hypothetical protein
MIRTITEYRIPKNKYASISILNSDSCKDSVIGFFNHSLLPIKMFLFLQTYTVVCVFKLPKKRRPLVRSFYPREITVACRKFVRLQIVINLGIYYELKPLTATDVLDNMCR